MWHGQGAIAMTAVQAPTGAASNTTWKNAPTQTIDVGGVQFAYRQLGPSTGVPVVFLTHLAAVLDNWDPRVVDGIAAKHRVIRADGERRGDLHPRPRPRAGRPARVLYGRHDRPGDRAGGTAARAQADP